MATSAMLTACGTKTTEEVPTDYIGKSTIRTDKLTPELLQELGKLSDIQPSPDGTRLMYGVTYTSVQQNKSNRELFVLDVNSWTAEARNITKSKTSEQNAVWLDNDHIAFLSAEGGLAALWLALSRGLPACRQWRNWSTIIQT